MLIIKEKKYNNEIIRLIDMSEDCEQRKFADTVEVMFIAQKTTSFCEKDKWTSLYIVYPNAEEANSAFIKLSNNDATIDDYLLYWQLDSRKAEDIFLAYTGYSCGSEDGYVYYITNTIDAYSVKISGYFGSLIAAKLALQSCRNWYRPVGTGSIYRVPFGLDAKPELILYKD